MTVLLPEGYAELLARVKSDVLATRLRMLRTANNDLIGLYWRIGKLILEQQLEQGWGTRVIDRLAADLRRELGEQRGWSRSNLFSMRALAAARLRPGPTPQSSNRLLDDCPGARSPSCSNSTTPLPVTGMPTKRP